MIYLQTILTITTDNTDAKKIMCIQVLGVNKKYAEIGCTIIISFSILLCNYSDSKVI